MPCAIYHNNGSGRDSYVNGACLSESRRTASSNPQAAAAVSFWPRELPAAQRLRERIEGISTPRGSLNSSTISSPNRLTSPTISTPRSYGQYVSPARELGLLNGGFENRGLPSPRGALPDIGSPRLETEAMYAGRTGRFATPRAAPESSGKLPGLKLHQRVGILNEV